MQKHFDKPEDRIADRMMLEARCLEWLAELLQNAQSTQIANACCSKQDEIILHSIAKFLEENLTVETTLAELSRRFGINEFKLKQGFRQLFQSTVFKYLKNKRMEHAEALLRENELTVIDVANRVGYSNPGHFSRAFKERYGLLPKAYQCIHRERKINNLTSF